jgi:hypothetical protein
MYIDLHVKCLLFLSDSDKFSQNTQISAFMKIRPMGAKVFHEDRLDEVNGRFSKFYESA